MLVSYESGFLHFPFFILKQVPLLSRRKRQFHTSKKFLWFVFQKFVLYPYWYWERSSSCTLEIFKQYHYSYIRLNPSINKISLDSTLHECNLKIINFEVIILQKSNLKSKFLRGVSHWDSLKTPLFSQMLLACATELARFYFPGKKEKMAILQRRKSMWINLSVQDNFSDDPVILIDM